MKVYLVWYFGGQEDSLDGVFATKALAKKHIKSLCGDVPEGFDNDFMIETKTVISK